jgi:hypothetical protein
VVAFWKRAQHDDDRSAKQETHVQEKHGSDAAAGEIPPDAGLPRAENGDVSPRQPQARDA